MFSKADMYEIRWHGRGGQGAISSAKFLAEAAHYGGFLGVTSAPSFGAERRGAPVTASTRLARKPVRVFSQVEQPDVVVVLDDTLLEGADPTAGLKDGGWLIVNTHLKPAELGLKGGFSVATADADAAARETGMVVAGIVMVNTAMLGAFARATELVSLENIRRTLDGKFPEEAARKNFETARITYERTLFLPREGL